MKIALIALHFSEYVLELARELAKEQEILLILDEKEKDRIFRGLSFDLPNDLAIKTISHRTFRNPAFVRNVCLLRKWVINFDPDVIHIQDSAKVYLSIAVCFLRKYPIIVTVHDPILHVGEGGSWHHKFAKELIRKKADAFIVHGLKIKNDLSALYPNPTKKIFTIPHGCLMIFKDLGGKEYQEDTRCILFFGRIYEYKGLAYLIEAMEHILVKVPDAKLVIAGTGSDLERHRSVIEKNPNFILYDRYIPNEEVAELFQKASIVVLPYIEATQSGVLAVAYSFGKPVVSSDVGSIAEVLINYKTGILVPPKDVYKLAEAILYLLQNDSVRKEMGYNALSMAQKELSWQSVAFKHLNCYDELINK